MNINFASTVQNLRSTAFVARPVNLASATDDSNKKKNLHSVPTQLQNAMSLHSKDNKDKK